MSGTIDIQIMQLVFAYIFVLVLLFIVKQKEIGHKGEILLASVRYLLSNKKKLVIKGKFY